MVKEFRIFAQVGYKNNDALGGAMKVAISKASATDIVLLSISTNRGKVSFPIKPSKAVDLVMKKDNGLYEYITKFPHKVYFDCDGDGKDSGLLEKVKAIVTKYFPDAEMAISGSVADTKTSYHITLQNYHIHNEDERLQIKNLVKYIHSEEESAFDPLVYNKNRLMKCVNQSKGDGRIQQLIENNDWTTHFITAFLPTYSLPFAEFPEPVKRHIAIQKSKSNFNILDLPRMSLEVPKDVVWNELTPLQVLKLTPCQNKKLDWAFSFIVARFAFHNGLTFEEFLSWITNKWIWKKYSDSTKQEKANYWKSKK